MHLIDDTLFLCKSAHYLAAGCAQIIARLIDYATSNTAIDKAYKLKATQEQHARAARVTQRDSTRRLQ